MIGWEMPSRNPNGSRSVSFAVPSTLDDPHAAACPQGSDETFLQRGQAARSVRREQQHHDVDGSVFGPPHSQRSGAFSPTSPSSLLRYSVAMPVAYGSEKPSSSAGFPVSAEHACEVNATFIAVSRRRRAGWCHPVCPLADNRARARRVRDVKQQVRRMGQPAVPPGQQALDVVVCRGGRSWPRSQQLQPFVNGRQHCPR